MSTNELELLPYFHPTTIVFVDDNESFLESLDLELPGHWACRSFNDPNKALEFLEQPPLLPPLMDRCFSMDRHKDSGAVIHLDLGMIEQEISHRERFARNSVIVVDYAMPYINGLEFCRALTDPWARKAMLTGVADEKLAVEAFNAGLIHRFIPKQTAEPVVVVRQFVEELLREYFSQYSARLKSTLAIDPPPFLTDPAVACFIEQLRAEHGLVEYYLVDEPEGFIMLKANGELWRVAILDDAGMREQLARARGYAAPPEILEGMSSGRLIGFLAQHSPADYFGDDEHYPWAELIFPVQVVQGQQQRWSVAIWRDAPADIDFDRDTACYDAYLRSL